MPSSFDYAVIRVVPRVDREEFVNVGVILFCLERRFLGAAVHVDEQRLRALWPEIDLDTVRRHVHAIPAVCSAEPSAGPIGRLDERERFHWLVAPRSTVVQVSPVHSGVCDAPEVELEKLFATLVRRK